MRWPPRIEDKAAWSGVGGVLTAVMAGAAYISPLWPLWGGLAAVSFYFALAPLLRLPPWHKPLTVQEEWFRGRIAIADDFARQRAAMGDDWYFRKMNEWDFENFEELVAMKSNPALAGYKENPKTEEEDGIYPPAGEDGLSESALSEAELRRHYSAEHDRYYAQRLAWLETTFRRLRRGR
jgi:hypothetical protein